MAKTKTLEKLKELMAEYGPWALGTWLVIWALVWVGMATAIQMGYQPETTTETGGIWLTAYVATQFTKPARIAATFVLTPMVARVGRRFLPPREK